jgi:hypothetical protein
MVAMPTALLVNLLVGVLPYVEEVVHRRAVARYNVFCNCPLR